MIMVDGFPAQASGFDVEDTPAQSIRPPHCSRNTGTPKGV
jgi:hypothetical protein